jgi:pimeloyl-ACP methyl ester carboxylesterase
MKPSVAKKRLMNISAGMAGLLVSLSGGMIGCGQAPVLTEATGTDASTSPDYQESSAWVTQASSPDKPIDVFYVYPTIYSADSPPNMDFQDEALRSAAEHLMTAQAGVYSNQANLFAPYYRQMSMARLNPDEDMFQNEYFKVGYSDISRAFTYYLEHLNEGRPFILAGHSQGSMALISLMQEYFDDPELQERLVAAYLIGYSITPDILAAAPWMRTATGADDTGVIISYNTQAPGATGSPVLLPGAFCINPLTWTTDATPAGKEQNLGAVFFNDTQPVIEREIPQYAGATVNPDSGALITELPEELDGGGFPPGIYHRFDYELWFRNLEANVTTRCKQFLSQKK